MLVVTLIPMLRSPLRLGRAVEYVRTKIEGVFIADELVVMVQHLVDLMGRSGCHLPRRFEAMMVKNKDCLVYLRAITQTSEVTEDLGGRERNLLKRCSSTSEVFRDLGGLSCHSSAALRPPRSSVTSEVCVLPSAPVRDPSTSEVFRDLGGLSDLPRLP